MKKPRKLTSLPIRQALFALSLALSSISAQAESRALKITEGELADELLGLIAEQSGCSRYAVAWLESTTQQVNYRCVEMLPEAQGFTAILGTKTKFLIEVSRAKAGYRQRFGNAGLRRPISLLAYLLVTFRAKPNQRNASAPVLVYRPIVQSERSDEKNEFALRSRDQ